MAAVGDTYTLSTVRAGADADTTGTYTVIDGDDQAAAAGPAGHPDPADPTLFDAAPLLLTGPGEWVCTWTFTGAGAGQQRQRLTVDPDPDPDPGPGPGPGGFSYATTGDYARYTGRSGPPGLRRTLAAATVEIDRITRAARYRTDPGTGRAVDPAVRAALAAATCELVDWWTETGLESGGRHLYTSASIGGVSLGWGGANTQNPQADRVGPKIWSILLTAGLLTPGAVLTDG